MKDYFRSESYLVTVENITAEYLNAETPYARWRAFNKLLQWIDSLEEVNWRLKNDSSRDD